mgnify:CR=1 FL=1
MVRAIRASLNCPPDSNTKLAKKCTKSDRQFALAQDEINRLYAKSISGAAGTLLINDLTAPYYVPPYEQALTFFFRGMNFLQQNDLQGALVEARKAVFYLDYLRGSKNKGYPACRRK